MNISMRFKIIILLFHLVLTACSTMPGLPMDVKNTAYQNVRANQFAPVNLFINPGDYIYQSEEQLLDYLRDQLEKSGAFMDISSVPNRYPFTIEAHFSREEADSAVGGVTKGIIGGGTLGIIPVNFNFEYKLQTKIYFGAQLLSSTEYVENGSVKMSIYNGYNGTKDVSIVIDKLVMRFIEDIENDKVLPRSRDLHNQDRDSSDESVDTI